MIKLDFRSILIFIHTHKYIMFIKGCFCMLLKVFPAIFYFVSSLCFSVETQNPLLFKIGPVVVLGTQHNVPYSCLPENTKKFIESMSGGVHCVEHTAATDMLDFIKKMDALPHCTSESATPILEKLKSNLSADYRESLDRICQIIDPTKIKPAALLIQVFLGSSRISNLYEAGMDEYLDGLNFQKTLELESLRDLFNPILKLSNKQLLGISPEKFFQEDEGDSDFQEYLSGNLEKLEERIIKEDGKVSIEFLSKKHRRKRNATFASRTLQHIDSNRKQTLFVSMGCNHLLGAYGYLNMMSLLLKQPLERFDEKSNTFVSVGEYSNQFESQEQGVRREIHLAQEAYL